MSRFAAIVALVAAVAMCACDRRPAATLSDSVATMIEPIDTGLTLGKWIGSHPRDSVGTEIPVGDDPALVCRTAVAREANASPSVRRFAVFHFPDPPSGEAFPADTTHLDRRCVLRALWVDIAERDSLRALALAESIARALTARFGAAANRIEMMGIGAGKWTNGRTWKTSATTVVLGITPHEPAVDDPEGGRRLETLRRVIVAAYGPGSGLGNDDWTLDLDGHAAVEVERPIEIGRAHV